jgi:heme/copper-type cytochrome/quinol oxidase subunit 3
MKSDRAALKTALLAPSGPVFAWSIQTALAGDVVTGLIGCLIGVAMVAGFVVLEEKDIPYEAEIVELIAQADSERAAKEAAEAAGEKLSEYQAPTPPDQTPDTDAEE